MMAEPVGAAAIENDLIGAGEKSRISKVRPVFCIAIGY